MATVLFVTAKDQESKHPSLRTKIMLQPYNNHSAAIKMNETVLCVQTQKDQI